MCAKIRSKAVDRVTRSEEKNNGMRGCLLSAVIAVALLALLPDLSKAGLPAPKFMPGFPLSAGPQVIMMWSPVPGAAKYKVYFEGKAVAETQGVQHMLPAPEKGGEYKIEVSAVDPKGGEGDRSAPYILRIFSLEPPNNLVTLVSGTLVNLRWDPAQGAAIYNIFKRRKGESEYKLLNSVQDARFTDSTGKVGEEYEYAISSKDLSGKESAKSELAIVKILPPEVRAAAKEYKIDPWPTSRQLGVEMPNFTNDVATRGKSAVASMDFLVYFPDVSSSDYQVLLSKKPGFGGVGFGPDGRLYAANQAERKIYVINPDANEVLATHTIPAPGKGVLRFQAVSGEAERNNSPLPYDVAVDSSGNLYVTDTANFRVAILSSDGRFLRTMGYEEGSEDWQIASPSFITIDSQGRKYVTGFSEISVFSAGDRFEGVIGKPGQEFGAFSRPRGVTFDEQNNIFVADSMGNNVQVFRENAQEKIWEPVHLLTNESKDGNPSWATPMGIALLSDGRTLVVSEAMGKRVSVFNVKR